MPINFVTSLPRTGKTLFTFIQVIDRAKNKIARFIVATFQNLLFRDG